MQIFIYTNQPVCFWPASPYPPQNYNHFETNGICWIWHKHCNEHSCFVIYLINGHKNRFELLVCVSTISWAQSTCILFTLSFDIFNSLILKAMDTHTIYACYERMCILFKSWIYQIYQHNAILAEIFRANTDRIGKTIRIEQTPANVMHHRINLLNLWLDGMFCVFVYYDFV